LTTKTLFAVVIMLLVFMLNLFRGGGKRPSVIGNEKCSALDWLLLAALISVGVIGTIFAAKWVSNDFHFKESLQYNFVKGEMKMTPQKIFLMGVLGFVSGFTQAGFGLGSGMMVGPWLIQLDQHPASSAATAMLIALLNATSATLTVIILGKLNYPYAIVLCVMAAIGTVPGIWAQHKLVKVTKRPSVTVLIMSVFIAFSIFANPAISLSILFSS
jgi:uncharacterized membrane protein YfcA